jgi:hypothetical protein
MEPAAGASTDLTWRSTVSPSNDNDRDVSNRLPDSTEPTEDDDVMVYLANALNDVRKQLDRAQSIIVTAMVIARLVVQRRNDRQGDDTNA